MIKHLTSQIDTINEINNVVAELIVLTSEHRVDYNPIFFEVLSNMLIVIADNNRFYYSDTGSINIEQSNFYGPQAGGASTEPKECYRIGNRMALFTNKTIEFWDVSLDFENPLVARYGDNVYSYTVLKNSSFVFDDTVYCIASSTAMPYYSLFKIDKSGQMQKISYPELEFAINSFDFSHVKTSCMKLGNQPIICWFISGVVYCYNVIRNVFFQKSNLELYLYDDIYLNYISNLSGRHKDFYVRAEIKLPSLNLDRNGRNLKTVNADLYACAHKGLNNVVHMMMCRNNTQEFKSNYYSKLASELYGKKNLIVKWDNLGKINDNRMSMCWCSDIDINKITWTVE